MRHSLALPSQFLKRATLPSPRSSPSRLPRRNQSSKSAPENTEPLRDTNKSQTSAPSQNQTQPQPQPQPHHQPTSPPPSNSNPTPPTPTTPAQTPSPAAAAAASVSRRSLRQIIVDGPLGNLGRSYSRVQSRRPYATQLWSSVIIYLCGDLSAQYLFGSDNKAVKSEVREEVVEKDQNKKQDDKAQDDDDATATTTGGYDPWRTLRHLTVGAGSSIPSYNWFMFLHNNFNFTSKFLSILTKVCVQQAVFTPVFNTYFFSVHSLLSGATLEETFERLKKALPTSIYNSCKLWPGVTAFSFMYVPAQFRNIFSGVIAVGWQTYLSWLNQKAAREVEAKEVVEEMVAQGESAAAGQTAVGMKA